MTQDDRIRGHEGADRTRAVGRRAGDLEHRVTVREDPDEPPLIGDEDSVDPLVVHPPDRLVDVGARIDHLGRGDPEPAEVLAEELAAERDRGVRGVVAGEIRAAVVADVRAQQVLEAAGGAAHRRPRPYSTVQVSPLARAAARSPSPWAATAA